MKDTKKKKKKDNWIEHSKPVGYYWYEKVKRIRTGQTEPLFLELRAQQFPKSMKGIKSKIKEAQNPKKKKKKDKHEGNHTYAYNSQNAENRR